MALKKKLIKLEKTDKAFSDYKCNLQRFSLLSKVPVGTQNPKDIDEPEFLSYPRAMYPGKHGDTKFCPFFLLLCKTPK